MSNVIRRRLFQTLFSLWCVSLSLVLYDLLMPWSQVFVTAGILFVVIGVPVGIFGESPRPRTQKSEGEAHG